MKFRFESALPHQRPAIQAVVDVFDGQPRAESRYAVARDAGEFLGTRLVESVVANRLALAATEAEADARLLANVQAVQRANRLDPNLALDGRHFSIEMETGTGKTYVYLATIHRLHEVYGFAKFVIVVPSVAVREGVLKSIELTREHFHAAFGVSIQPLAYSADHLARVRQFAGLNTLQVMVINIQAFQKDIDDAEGATRARAANVINREQDAFAGRRPIELIQATSPIVVVDEPQNMETEGARAAIARLNPLCTLRYSATHRQTYNLLYRLDPIAAYDQKLVKRIEVASVRADENLNAAYVRVESIDAQRGFKARLRINVQGPRGAAQKSVTVKPGDNLFDKSKGREEYRSGYIVHNLVLEPGAERVEFANGLVIPLHGETGGMTDDVMKVQVRETVERHLEKELALSHLPPGRRIKVLSLFFIDRVANYRAYTADGQIDPGKIAVWFEDAYREFSTSPKYRALPRHDAATVHDGYFSTDKRSGRYKDSTERGSKDDESAFETIMRNKERLLDPDVPLRFVFSHSALREGWDNPNVFQICTLNESVSTLKKRQEIGRGLRLPVNEAGERIRDERVNQLTVVANEAYDQFARALQTEYEEDCGVQFDRVPPSAFVGLALPVPAGSGGGEVSRDTIEEDAAALWDHLRRAGYLDDTGTIQASFTPDDERFALDLPEMYDDLRPIVTDILKKHLFARRVTNANRPKRAVRYLKSVEVNEDFAKLWEKIARRTRYRVSFSSEAFVAETAKRSPAIAAVNVEVERVGLALKEGGVRTDDLRGKKSVAVAEAGREPLPDLVTYLQSATRLSRKSLAAICIQSGRLNDFVTNPQAFLTRATEVINKTMHQTALNGLRYEPLPGLCWKMERLEKDAEAGLLRYLNTLYPVRHQEKSVYDLIEYQSEVERQFAHDLDHDERVKLFVKLPRWFKVRPPLDPYIPDWAIVITADLSTTSSSDGQKRLYLVCESKGTTDPDQLRSTEEKKVRCGQCHFDALRVDFRVALSARDALYR